MQCYRQSQRVIGHSYIAQENTKKEYNDKNERLILKMDNSPKQTTQAY